MKFNFLKAITIASCLVICSFANAGIIYSATSVLNAPDHVGMYSASNTIQQNGLSSKFTSGVTDFDTYLTLSPVHTRRFANFFASFAKPTTNVDFDMGTKLTFSKLALWNYPFKNVGGINGFSIYSSNTSDFSVTSFLGAFNASDDGNGNANSAQVFDFTNTNARYLRLSITSAHSDSGVGFAEIAFEGVKSTVPEPSTLAIFALGMIGLASRRFKK